MSVPEKLKCPLFDEMENVKPLLEERVDKYGDELCAQLLSFMDALESLYIETRFNADCQEYVDANANARFYRAAAGQMEQMASLLAQAGHRVSLSLSPYPGKETTGD
jgi:hypothetical protein